ncbi:hypothetical protein C8A00DRAFT_43745 [Chaetomidium leptoderma]|uniref:Uncharacterized protein n=1 Tax=Chaetomidium leptoderma TaxID=669021 RepID=A0AAN6VLH5_9PEZI|nr:hypothetical protein C8A00DRAFT_43745 [Chaetomidium leptoderma]
MHSHHALNASVEAWIDHIIKAGGQTVIMPDGPDSLPTTEPAVTPRQANKRQRQASTDFHNDDLETTLHRGQSRNSLSEVQSTSTANTNGTSRSGRSSPRKKEVALRRTLDWPVARVNVTELKSIPAMLESLALDLKRIADGRQSLIPDIFRPYPDWFYTTSDEHEDLSTVHRQIRRIYRNNTVDFRNITLYRTFKLFYDNDPTLRENKVNYSIFLQPARRGDGLSERLLDLANEADRGFRTARQLGTRPLPIARQGRRAP